jgi:hypothetical protein
MCPNTNTILVSRNKYKVVTARYMFTDALSSPGLHHNNYIKEYSRFCATVGASYKDGLLIKN